MVDERPISLELYHEISQFLFKEARLLDGDRLREWYDSMLDPEISYRLVIGEERFGRDGNAAHACPINDDYGALDLRVRQVESGLRTMLDPREKLRRYVSNIEAFPAGGEGEFQVYSYGLVTRNRRLTEHEQYEYGREDILRRGQDGELRLRSRVIELDQRVVRGKNLLFFL